MNLLLIQPVAQAHQNPKKIALTRILNFGQLLRKIKTTWSNNNMWFHGGAWYTPRPPITPLVPSGQYPSLYESTDYQDHANLIPTLEVLLLDRSDWNPSVYGGSDWTIRVDGLILSDQFNNFSLTWATQLSCSILVLNLLISGQELIHFWAIWLEH